MNQATEQMHENEQTAGYPIRGLLRSAFILFLGLLLTAVVIAAAECGLILFDIAPPIPLFVDNPFSDSPAYAVNPGYYQQFMYRLGGKPTPEDFEMWGFSIPKVKPPDTCRIVLLGGSAAFGHPNPEFGFHEILRVMLQDAAPEIPLEIYNLACPILNAYVMEEIAEACIKIEPDLFLVYMGNNEYDGPFGPAWHKDTFLATHVYQPLLHLSRKFRLLRLAKSLRRRAGWDPWEDVDSAAYFNTLLPVRQSSRSRASMYRRFKHYVEGICAAARQAGAQVVLSSVGTNLKDWPPFVSQNDPNLSQEAVDHWNALYRKGGNLEKAGALDEALEAYEAAAALDPVHAMLQFRIGTCRLALGDRERAKAAFQKARDEDCEPFRTDSSINALIKDLSEQLAGQEVYYADAESALHEADSQAISGNGLFYDNVHLLFPGNYAIAACLFPRVTSALRKAGFRLPDTTASAPPETCKERLGLSPRQYYRHYECALGHLKYITDLEAFQDVLQDHDTEWLEREVQALVQTADTDVETTRGSPKYGTDIPQQHYLAVKELWRQEDKSTAVAKAAALAEIYKERPDAHLLYAQILELSGDSAKSSAIMNELKAMIRWDAL
ncbi:MAG TPA: hypothetical protein PLL36_01050 [Candidatus Hydrogenedentes bacterium]|nr:hypothetical protein [Candidatus Hydrogenedentota bacterium]HQM99627.1 hypothetical protein [Candidatus Hydrogenedentota bacterium]